MTREILKGKIQEAREKGYVSIMPKVDLEYFTRQEIGSSPADLIPDFLYVVYHDEEGRVSQDDHIGSLKLSDDRLAEVLEQTQDWARPKRISLDNGHSWSSIEEVMDVIDHPDKYKGEYGFDWDVLVSFMDDDVREEIHCAVAPCDKRTFLEAYMARATYDLIIG